MDIALASIATKRSRLFFYYQSDDYSHVSFPSTKKEKETVYYPESDGKQMADNTKQFNWIVKIKEGFELLFANNPDVFVAGDLLWYPKKGNNKIRVAPDTMIVFGRPKGDRGSYRSWDEENINPQIVFEILSPGNRRKEMEKKLKFYEQYKVEEYYVYDPYKIKFTVYIRSGMKLNFIETVHGWISPILNVYFKISNQDLRIFAPDGREFISPLETSFKLDDAVMKQGKADARADVERQKAEAERQKAEAERQKAEAERQKVKAERQKAKTERQKAKAERQKAKAERQKADDAIIKQHKAEEIATDAVLKQHKAEEKAKKLAEKLKELGIVIEL